MDTSTLNTKPAPKSGPVVAAAPPPNRMSIANAKKGIVDVPHRVLVYGAEKIGKSTFAAGAPNPIFLGKDDGTEHLDIARMPRLRTWKDVLAGVHSIVTEDHDFKTLVIDPVNWLEPMLHDEVTEGTTDSIEAWNGGYGRGYDAAIVKWRVLIDLIARGVWRKRQMNVIIVAHGKLTNFNDPKGPAFKRWSLAMANDRVSDVFRQWVETILFVERTAYGIVDSKTKRVRAAGDAAVVAHTEWNPAYDAGNRWTLPSEIPLSWMDYVDAVAEGKGRAPKLRNEIESMLEELGDAELTKKVHGYLADLRVSVVEIHNKLSARVGAKREQEQKPVTEPQKEEEEAA